MWFHFKYFVVTLEVSWRESKNLSYCVSPATDAMTTAAERISPPVQNIDVLVGPGRVLSDDATHVTIGSIIKSRHLECFTSPVVVTTPVMAEGKARGQSPSRLACLVALGTIGGSKKNLSPPFGYWLVCIIV